MRKLLDQLPARTLPFEPDKSQPNIAVNMTQITFVMPCYHGARGTKGLALKPGCLTY
jgi:hypothetical protein